MRSGLQLLLKPLREAGEHCVPARHKDVGVQVLADVHVAGHDRREDHPTEAVLRRRARARAYSVNA